MWTVIVEVTLVGADHDTGVALAVDQHPVRALRPDASNEPFCIAVRARRPGWSLDDLDVVGGEHRVERLGELRVPVPDQEPKAADPVAEIHHEVTSLLGGPLGGRVSGDTEDVHPPGGNLHHDQHVQPAQRDGVDVEEVGREQPGHLRSQEGSPAGVDITWRRADPGGAEDAADGAGADPVAKPDQFPLYPPVPPSRVLPGQPEDKVTYLVADPRASWSVRVGPMPADHPAVPGHQRAAEREPRPRAPPGPATTGAGVWQPAEHPNRAQVQQPNKHA